MKKSIFSDLLFLRLYHKIALLLISSSILSCGCIMPKQRYNKISFCWTSNHRLAPDERFLSVNASPRATVMGIIKWAKQKEGEILENEDNYGYLVRLQPDSKQVFSAKQEIVQKEWAAYDANTFRKREDNEWQTLQQLSKSEITLVKSQEENGHRLKIKLGNRDRTIAYRKRVETVQRQQLGYTYTKGGDVIVDPIPMTAPTYETRHKTISFYSLIEFIVFSDQGRTLIYAVGLPVDGSSSVQAAYGYSIGHSWWPMVTGKEEASLIKDAYSYLAELDRLGELDRLAGD